MGVKQEGEMRKFEPRAREKRWLDAYYYSFDETGVEAIDSILAAVASAGKRYHNTDQWQEEYDDDESCADAIQRMAEEAAEAWKSTTDGCPLCGADEVEAHTPRTVYACGTSSYDDRPGTWRQGVKCCGRDRETTP